MLPFQVKVFVLPGHADLARLQAGAVLADKGDVDEATAAHGLGDGQLDLVLGSAGLGPIALDHLLAVLDLDECAPRFVARPPQCDELLTGLDLPVWRGQQLRNANGQLRRLGLENL